MEKATELHQIVHSLLAVQIEFGTYRYKEPLPKIEDASRWLSVSVDTVRAAYLQLKREGYITLTKKAGAAVAVNFQPSEIEEHIQTFFSVRREAVIDLCHSLGPLLSHLQWFALKNASTETLDELERLCGRPETLMPYVMIQHCRLLYGTLHNDLLLRLVLQAFLFYQVPFLSLPENLVAFADGDDPLRHMTSLCRQKAWDELWQVVAAYQVELTTAIELFFETRIRAERAAEPVAFRWSPYQNTSQRCYTLAMELLQGVKQGRYLQDDEFLLSPTVLAQQKHVSISTVRRALMLLKSLGVTESLNGVGTRILSTSNSAKRCDFTEPVIQKRLLDFAQSLQILTLTCGACAKSTYDGMDDKAIRWWEERIREVEASEQYESIVFASLEVIARFSPIQAVREIYTHLLRVLIWGYPLRSLHGTREAVNDFYRPVVHYQRERVACRDWAGLTCALEKLMDYELRFALDRLEELDIPGTGELRLPQSDDADRSFHVKQ